MSCCKNKIMSDNEDYCTEEGANPESYGELPVHECCGTMKFAVHQSVGGCCNHEEFLDMEIIREVKRWADRLIKLDNQYKNEIEDMNLQMEEGFKEAYEVIETLRNKNKELWLENEELKKKLKECGC